jgi:hypothetical protein
MLVVDFMHECELGTWKGLFTHLIRLLYALPGGDNLVASLDYRFVCASFSMQHTDSITFRFRHIPSYGNGVIRKFANNTSEMKRLAARDFENILQVCLFTSCSNLVRINDNFPSAQFRFSKDFSLETTTGLYSRFCIDLRIGMLLRNSVCTPKRPYRFSMTRSRASLVSYANSVIQHALHSPRRNYRKKRLHASARLRVNALISTIRMLGTMVEDSRNST